LGFPTANLSLPFRAGQLVLPYGVYATWAVLGRERWASVTNIGVRPTVYQEGEPLVETHLLDVERDLYGEDLEVRFVARVRDERRFNGLEELKAQIAKDVVSARVGLGLKA
jgi:riboflavin kinase/FMN adenylyltransferase